MKKILRFILTVVVMGVFIGLTMDTDYGAEPLVGVIFAGFAFSVFWDLLEFLSFSDFTDRLRQILFYLCVVISFVFAFAASFQELFGEYAEYYSTDFLGSDYFEDQYLMNSATPIHYALTVLGREQLDLYRDYTHMSDYGRLICAYQWYAQLMGLEEITEVNMDTIPTNLKHNNSKFPVLTNGVYPVTQDMKEDLIESVNWALKNPWNMPEN